VSVKPGTTAETGLGPVTARHPLRERGFRLYFASMTLSSFGSSMTQVALPFAVFGIGGGGAGLALVYAAMTVPKVVLVLVGGVISDRLDRRAVLFASNAMQALAQLGTMVLLMVPGSSIWGVVGLAVVYGSANAFVGPAQTGLLPELVPALAIQRANSLLRMSLNAAKIIGPSAAGVVVATANPGWAYAVDGVTFILAALAMIRLPAPRGRARVPGGAVLPDLLTGWREFSRTAWIWLMVSGFAIYQATVLPAIYVLGPVITRHGIGVSGWAAILTARGVGAVLAGFPLLRWHPSRPIMVAAALLLLDVPLLAALAGGAGLPLLLITAALSALALTAADALWETSLQQRVRPELLSRISSFDWFGSTVFSPVGYAAVGAMVGHVSPVTLLSVIACAHGLLHLLLPCLPAIRDMAGRDAGEKLSEVASDCPDTHY
jgi:hypothetical protein